MFMVRILELIINKDTSEIKGNILINQSCLVEKNFRALHGGRNGFKFAYGFKR